MQRAALRRRRAAGLRANATAANASWRLVYTNPEPGYSQSGLRGLTAIADPASGGEVLLAAVEGSDGRIMQIDPRNGNEATDLNLSDFLSRAWGMEVGYTIAAYNDMTKVAQFAEGRTCC